MNDYLISLPPPTDLKWGVMYSPMHADDDDCMPLSGAMSWKSEVYSKNGFQIAVFQEDGIHENGTKILETRMGADPSKKNTNFSLDLSAMLLFQARNNTLDTGRYYFTVQVLGDQDTTSDSAIYRSASWSYTKPQLALPQVFGDWDGTDVSLFYSPDDFSDASRKFLRTFYAKVMYQTESGVVQRYYAPNPDLCDWNWYGAHITLSPLKNLPQTKRGLHYCCQFCAVSKDITLCQNGPWSSTDWKAIL